MLPTLQTIIIIKISYSLRENTNDTVQAHGGNETGAEYWISWPEIDAAGA